MPEREGLSGFVAHLLELRNRMLYLVLVITAVFIALLPWANEIYTFVAQPLIAVMPPGASMIATDVASPFLTPLKLVLIAAVILTIPHSLYQIWAFVAPGLYRHERRLVIPLLLSSTLLFYGGMAFAYYLVFPLVFQFLVQTVPKGVMVMTDIRAYMDFVLAMFIAFGIAFETPVAVVLLARMGVVNPATLAKKRPYIVLGIFIVAAILTPPDAVSQTLLALPMWLLFEIGLVVARYTVRRPARPEGAMTEEEMDVVLERHLDGSQQERSQQERSQ